MFKRIRTINRPHFETIEQLIKRDIPIQVMAVLLVCCLTAWAGYWTIATFVAIWVVATEWTLFRVFSKQAPFRTLDKDQKLIVGFFIGAINAAVYLVPSLLLARDPSLAIKLMALLWVLGVQIHVSNTWSRVPLFLFTRLMPTLVMLVLTVFGMSAVSPTASTQLEWSLALAFVFVFVYVTIETLRHNLKTEWALVKAEAEASARASQLEDAQRIDVLTGLLNRPAFDTALNVILTDLQDKDGHVAVYMIDLDNFKPINDTYSHVAGDVVLEAIAARLKQVVGDFGIVGRMGGDEFICAVCDLESTEDAMQMGRDLAQVISRAIEWNNHQLKVYGSVGFAISTSQGVHPPSTVSSLCSTADQAMYVAKNSPKSDPVMFRADLFDSRLSPLDKQALIEAVSNHRLRPYYQPKINLSTGQVIGFEALARWHHPDGSIRKPDEFVNQLRELGLQGDFITSITRQVVNDVNKMLNDGLDPGQVSFNVPEIALATVSGRHELEAIISPHKDVVGHLTFEITEDVFIARAADAIRASIETFRASGIRISLDDFGTGFASFHHFQNLKFDEIKIDTTFIEKLGQDKPTDVLVQGFLDIAHGLDVDVVAEGVETAAQQDLLVAMGCKTAQGYLFNRAVPFEQATALLQTQRCA